MKPKLGAMTFPFIIEEGLKMGDFKPSVKLDLLVLDLMISEIASCCCSQLPRLLNELINVEHVI